MSDVVDFDIDLPTPELVKEVMERFEVDEGKARRIIAFCNVFAAEKMEKWKRNWKKIQKGKADDIYRLTRSLKRGKGNKLAIDEIEKRILELCIE